MLPCRHIRAHLAQRLRRVGFGRANGVSGELDEHILERRPAQADALHRDGRIVTGQCLDQHGDEPIAVRRFDNQLPVRRPAGDVSAFGGLSRAAARALSACAP